MQRFLRCIVIYFLNTHQQLSPYRKRPRSSSKTMELQVPILSLLCFCFILVANPTIVLGQTWTGSYKWAGRCDTTLCCCGTGTLTVTSSGSTLYFSGGGSPGCLSSRISWTASNPYNRYTFSQTSGDQTVVYTLSGDSQTITYTNAAATYCDDTAKKSSASNLTSLQAYWTLSLATLLLIARMDARKSWSPGFTHKTASRFDDYSFPSCSPTWAPTFFSTLHPCIRLFSRINSPTYICLT